LIMSFSFLSAVFLLYLLVCCILSCFFFSSRRRHTRSKRDWSSDVCSSDLVAFQDKRDIDAAYLRLIKTHLLEGSGFTSIATHDHNIIEETIDFIKENNIPNDQFEFQMLYGFRKDYQRNLVQRGYNTVVYVPFGYDWYAYFMRRLEESR